MAGVSASFTITGSYQIRVHKLGNAIQLSYLKEQTESLKTGLTASAGISVKIGSTDPIAKRLGAISKDEVDPKLLAGGDKRRSQDVHQRDKRGNRSQPAGVARSGAVDGDRRSGHVPVRDSS